jgi:hypothetical protein
MAKHKPTKPPRPNGDHGHKDTIEKLTQELEEIKGKVAKLGGTLEYTLTPPAPPAS